MGETLRNTTYLKEEDSSIHNRKLIFKQKAILFLISFCINMVTYVILFPGYFQADHQITIAQIAAGNPSQWHSLVWGYLAFPLIYLSPSYALYGLVQILLYCFSSTYVTIKLYELSIISQPMHLCLLYSLFPTFLLYNLLYCSDICFAYMIMILTVILIELSEYGVSLLYKKSYIAKLVGFLTISILLRKNAILIPLLLLPIMLFLFPKKRTCIMSIILTSLLVSCAIDQAFPLLLDADRSPSQEMLSIPAVQIARTYAEGNVPEEARNVFEEVRTAEEWTNVSYSYTADYAKDGLSLSPSFLVAWIKTGLENPVLYMKAYCELEYPFWEFGADTQGDDYGLFWCGTSVDFGDFDWFTLNNAKGLNKHYLNQFGTNKSNVWKLPGIMYQFVCSHHIPIITNLCTDILFNRALPLWTLLVCFIISFRFNSFKDYLIVAAPALSILLGFLLFAPMALFRYSVQIYYCLPSIMLWTIHRIKISNSLAHDNRI